LTVTTAGLGAVWVSRETTAKHLFVEDESGEVLIEQRVEDGDEIILSYTHSVEQTPIRDIYIVDGEGLRMDRMEFSSFGAGLPTDDIEYTDDGFVVYRDDYYDDLAISVGRIAEHTLIVDGTTYELANKTTNRVLLTVTE